MESGKRAKRKRKRRTGARWEERELKEELSSRIEVKVWRAEDGKKVASNGDLLAQLWAGWRLRRRREGLKLGTFTG